MNGIRQHDMRDCGSACLATILRHYRSFVPMVKISPFRFAGSVCSGLCAPKGFVERTAAGNC